MPVPAEVIDRVLERMAPLVEESSVSFGMPVLIVAPGAILEVVRVLRDELELDLFVDVTAVDWPGQQPRFEVVYHLYSTKHFARVRVKTRVPEQDPTLDSLISLYGAAAYMERECHDMYGIAFRGNADLRPILLYEGFEGHPLRKDYPKDREQPLVPYRT